MINENSSDDKLNLAGFDFRVREILAGRTNIVPSDEATARLKAGIGKLRKSLLTVKIYSNTNGLNC